MESCKSVFLRGQPRKKTPSQEGKAAGDEGLPLAGKIRTKKRSNAGKEKEKGGIVEQEINTTQLNRLLRVQIGGGGQSVA